MKKISKLNNKLHTPNWLFLLLIIVLIFRIPSLFEPYLHRDEMISLALGEAIRQEIPLYSGLYADKPPLLYIVAAIAGNLFWFKAILTFWIVITIYVFWKLTELLFPNNPKSQIVSTSIFALLTTIPLLEGNMANAELFMIGPTITAFLILMSKKLTRKNLFYSGVLFSISALFKVSAIFEIPDVIFLWVSKIKSHKPKVLGVIAKNTLFIFLGFAIIILLTFIWYFFQGSLREYVAAFLQNTGYFSSLRLEDVREPFLTKNFPLVIRILVLLVGFLILYRKRTCLSKNFIFATGWLLLSLFAATLSGKPYPHFLIQAIAPFSILVAMLFTHKTIEQVLVIIPITLFFFVPFYYKFWYYPTFPYYENFIKLTTGNYSNDQYFTTFGSDVIRNYKISGFITVYTTPPEKIFVWGSDSSTIYAMTKRFPPGKYVADYHIKDFSSDQETVSVLQENLPVYIVLLPSSSNISGMQNLLNTNYALIENIDGAEIWKLLNPHVRSLLAP